VSSIQVLQCLIALHIFWAFVCGYIGYLKGRPIFGIFSGVVLGMAGLVFVILLQNKFKFKTCAVNCEYCEQYVKCPTRQFKVFIDTKYGKCRLICL